MKTTLIFLFTFIMAFSYGQIQTNNPVAVEDLYLNNRYTASWPYYKDLLNKDPFNKELNYKMGVCYLNSRSQKEKALIYFNRALVLSDKENDKAIDFKQLGDACYYASKFDQAIINYKKYQQILLSKKDVNQNEIKLMDLKIDMCYMGKEIRELKELVDSFTSRTKVVDSLGIDPGMQVPNSNSIVSTKLSNGDEFFENTIIDPNLKSDVPLNLLDSTNVLKEATVATSVDGQIILIYRNEIGEGNLYASGLIGNEWTSPLKLQKSISNKGWEPNEFISDDGNTLFFSYEREGGYGGKDIYKCTKLPNGEWGKGVNLGPKINSSCDEEAPYIHSDGKVLFFSSNRYKTKGGFDIFTSCLSDSGEWGIPASTGYPVNKHPMPADSVTGKSKVEKNCFTATFIDQKRNRLTVIKGKVVEKDGKIPPYAEITITNNKTGEIAGVYNPNSETGEYLFVLPQEEDVNIIYQAKGNLFHSENIATTKSESYALHDVVVLVPVAKGSKEVLNNIFFEPNTASLSTTSDPELNTLYIFLASNKNMIVEFLMPIKKKSSKPQIAMAEERIQAVINYLLYKGITKERMRSRVYTLSERSIKKSGKGKIAKKAYDKLEMEILEAN